MPYSSLLMEDSVNLSRCFRTVDQAFSLVSNDFVVDILFKGDCGSRDIVFYHRLVIRVLDYITGVRDIPPSRQYRLRVRQQWCCLRVRLALIRSRLGHARLSESITALRPGYKFFLAFLRLWLNLHKIRTVWPAWMIHVLHYEFVKHLPLS